MRIALVHDWLNTRVGGSEQVLLELANLFPEADIYTLLFRANYYRGLIDPKRVHTSKLQNYPRFVTDRPRYLLPLLPRMIEQFDFTGYDIVISSSNAFSKGVITGPETVHLSYCYSPMRFAWDHWPQYLDEQAIGPIRRFVATRMISKLRLWDYYSSKRVDQYVAISNHVAKRIKKFYGADSKIIYPPVKLDAFKPVQTKGDYYVTLATLTPYKQIDQAIEACNQLKTPLIVIGDGFDRPRLEKIAGETIKFVGRVSDSERAKLLAEAKALLNPQEEDFGLNMVEALASGTPAIAYDLGGATEIIKDGQTGVLYQPGTADGLVRAIKRAQKIDFNSQELRLAAQRFDQSKFARAITKLVQELDSGRD